MINFSCKDKKEEYAQSLIDKVEDFKQINNRIPNDITEIGLTEQMDSPAFYQKENDSVYSIWYGISLGESNVYNSSTKKWKKEG